jgi:hypothetical protein
VSMLELRLFGPFAARAGGRPVTLTSARAQSLLACLALSPDRPVRRELATGRLWPDSTEPQARTNLRHPLHTVLPALGDHVTATARRRALAALGRLVPRLEAEGAIDPAIVAEALSEATGRPVAYVPVPDADARAAMVADGLPEMTADAIVAIFRRPAHRPDGLGHAYGRESARAGAALTGRVRPGERGGVQVR